MPHFVLDNALRPALLPAGRWAKRRPRAPAVYYSAGLRIEYHEKNPENKVQSRYRGSYSPRDKVCPFATGLFLDP